MNWGHIGIFICGIILGVPVTILLLALSGSAKLGDVQNKKAWEKEMEARMHSAIPHSPD